MQISRNIANGPKSNNSVLVGLWVDVCIQKPFHHFLQTFCPAWQNCCTSWKIAVVNIEACMHLIMSQQEKKKTKSLLDFYTLQKIESFLAYFMRILNSCLVEQDSILQTGVCASESNRTLLCSTARIRQDISATSFFRYKLLWRSDECVLLSYFWHAAWYFCTYKPLCRSVEFIFLLYRNLERW